MKPATSQIPLEIADRYRIERELGRGGMAVVYLAQDLRHHRPVALKVLRPELAAALGPDRFAREIEIAARLSHPSILPLYDSGAVDGALYYVMPYVAGGTLRQRIESEGQLPVEEAVRIALAVAAALSAAHAARIVHRDIKPENILLDTDRPMVSDFGIARLVSATGDGNISSSGLVIGTPGYMSPEQASGAARIDSRSDLYSLGCVLYEMLAGEPPFTGPTPQTVAMRQVNERVRSLLVIRPGLPPALVEVVEKALEKAPADRYQTAEELAAALRSPLLAAKAARSRRPLIFGALAALAAGAAVLVWLEPWGGRRLPTGGPDPLKLAVLRFQDQSEGEALAPFADGLTLDLIGELSRLSPLEVRSASAAWALAGAPIDSVARTLQVGTVVEGSVSGTRDWMRIRVWLTDASSNNQFASAKWDRAVGDLFELEDQITADVAAFLRERLGEKLEYQRSRSATRDLAAWEMVRLAERSHEEGVDLYERGELAAASRHLDRADSLYRLAEQRDRAWAGPVLGQGWIAVERAKMVPDDSLEARTRWMEAAVEHADRVLARDPGSLDALELRGTARFRGLVNVPGADTTLASLAERDLRAAAVPGNPELARTQAALSHVLRLQGHFAEANQLATSALEADAFLRDAVDVLFQLCSSSFELGRLDEAVRWCALGSRRFPDRFVFPFYQLMLQMAPNGPRPDPDLAWELVARLEQTRSAPERERERANWQMMVATILVRAGLPDSGAAVARRARSLSPPDPSLDLYDAAFEVTRARPDRAVELIGRFLGVLPQMRPFVRNHPLFATLRSDPRFTALVERP